MQSDDLTMPKYVGIDISKNHLDWALRSDEEGLLQTGRVANTPEQREQLSNRLAKAGPDRVVCEATGGLEHPLAAALVAEELPVAVVNPERTRDFAGALGRKEKSDPIDAEVLALFGERIRPEIRPLPSEQAQRMRALVKRRRQLVEMIGAEENRLERADDSARSSIERHLDFLQEELAETEETLEETLRQSEAWKVQEQLLCSVPGLGKTTARTLLALLPELGEANREEIAKLAGVAPIVQESGRWKGERHIEGGRPAVRHVLYMATMTAIQHNQRIRQFYQRLRDRGKGGKVALIAAMRKLLVILNTMMKTETPWQPDHSPAHA